MTTHLGSPHCDLPTEQFEFWPRGRTHKPIDKPITFMSSNLHKGTQRILRTEQFGIWPRRGTHKPIDNSPTMFICIITELADTLQAIQNLSIIFYVDNLVMYSEEFGPIKEVFKFLKKWCTENTMKENKGYAVQIGRKAGRKDTMEQRLKGITLQPSLTFTKREARQRPQLHWDPSVTFLQFQHLPC